MRLIKKSESRWHKLVARLPFIPKNYMTGFWTTVGSTVAVPAVYDTDPDWGQSGWITRHRVVVEHEMHHVQQWRRLNILMWILYLGPSPFLVLPCAVLAYLHNALWLLLPVALAPLTCGLAWGRWWIERSAYAIRHDQLRGLTRTVYANHIATTLWSSYFYTWPPALVRKWYAKRGMNRV